jgi:hypothetical protein
MRTQPLPITIVEDPRLVSLLVETEGLLPLSIPP